MKHDIDFDDITTWPDGLVSALNENNGISADNPKANEILSRHTILGFHCTRLLPNEVEDIRGRGLCALSPELLTNRITRAREAGFLSQAVSSRLISENQAQCKYRIGQTCFFTKRLLLKEPAHVHRFFDSWGGEALYNSHEDDDETGPVLKSLGEPCIVIASLPVGKLWEFQSGFAREFANKLLNDKNDGGGHRYELYGVSVRCAVPKDWLVRIVQSQDLEFKTLTGHD